MRRYFTWHFWFRIPKVLKYKLLSNNRNVSGKAGANQPVLLLGKGKIIFGSNVQLGYYPSPGYFSGYIHLEARSESSFIKIGDNVIINNNFFAISESEGIQIGDDTLIGLNCEIIDSDFHELDPLRRRHGTPVSMKVTLGNNVWLGNNVKITKGVELGNNVVVANSAVVVSSFPADVIIAGVPAKIIGKV